MSTGDFREVRRLPDFINENKAALVEAVLGSLPPIFDGSRRDDLSMLRRRPIGAQADVIRAAATSLRRHGCGIIVGETGAGKSYVAAAAAYLAGHRRVIVVAPPHLVPKWCREILATVPDAMAAPVSSSGDLRRLAARLAAVPASRPVFAVLSREAMKLGYRWRPAAAWRWLRTEPEKSWELPRIVLEAGRPVLAPHCPRCFRPVRRATGELRTAAELAARRHRCRHCGEQLWEADPTGPRRAPLAEEVARRLRGVFDLVIIDEVHEYKERGSAQGIAAGQLAQAVGRTLALTGTLFAGYSTNLLYLLHRFSRAVQAEFPYGHEREWARRYGLLRITRRSRQAPEGAGREGRRSRRREYEEQVEEVPGVSPEVLTYLLPITAFVRLGDIAPGLPSYREEVVAVPLDRRGEPSQQALYARLEDELRKAATGLGHGSRRLLSTYLQAVLAYPDNPFEGEALQDPQTGAPLVRVPPLPAKRLLPKEERLVALCREEAARGRRVLVYVENTRVRDLLPRLEALLRDAGLRAESLRSDTVPPGRREAWIQAAVRRGVQVLLCHPRLVGTGLDLLAFPTICWYQLDYSVLTTRQASRRSWRIGQTQPVRVVFLVYEGTLQARAVELIAAKYRASLALEGELTGDGLAAVTSGGSDLLLDLAQGLYEETRSLDVASVERLFREAHAATLAADRFLSGPGDEEPEDGDAPAALPVSAPAGPARERRGPAAGGVTPEVLQGWEAQALTAREGQQLSLFPGGPAPTPRRRAR